MRPRVMDAPISAVSDTFVARSSELRRIGTFLNDFCTRQDLARDQCLKLNLLVEELFTNTVRHGHRGDSEAPVWLNVESTLGEVRVVYEDTAPPFNPFALFAPTPDTTLSLRKIGGLGVLLTRELASNRDYTYLYGRNRIRLTLKR